jgi:riboflavin biosynthesis pyrimidine reductase
LTLFPLVLEIRCDLVDCFKSLKSAGINSLLVEGGANIIQSVLEFQLADQVVVTVRPCFLGGYRSLTHELPQPLNLENTAAASVGGDIVVFGKLQKRDSHVDMSVCNTGDAVCPENTPRSLVRFLE